MSRPSSRLATLAALVGLALPAWRATEAQEVYLVVPAGELTITEGELPRDEGGRQVFHAPGPFFDPSQARQPRAVLDGEGEVYLDRTLDDRMLNRLDRLAPDDLVAIRLPAPRGEVGGTLFVSQGAEPGMRAVRFKVDPAKAAGADGRGRFLRAKAHHYQRLLDQQAAGAAWFRHQVRTTGERQVERNRDFPDRGDALERTYSLFGGGRAIRENLQLDRPLQERAGGGNAAGIKLDEIRGITVAEIDWSARLAGKTPGLDPLAASIPADQHALFVPSLKAAGDLLALAGRWGTLPVVQLATDSAEDQGVQAFYEGQLGLSLAELARLADLQTIRGLAVTGSDPYFPTGTDLAVLFETERPEPLMDLLRERIDGLKDAERRGTDEVRGVTVHYATRPDRRVSAFAAAVGNVVILSNSPDQLDRVIAASKGEADRLSDLSEYRVFRDRYPLGDASESAFLMLSDATIRRWCGPRWRIGASRRLRAAAWLAEAQAANLEPVVRGDRDRPEGLKAPEGAPDLGELHWVPDGVASAIYGTLEFQTPILELDLTEATKAEADAYARWRDNYQRNWRGVFDPIALRISARPDHLSADLSVIPLIVASDYRDFAALAGDARLAPGAGDPHPEALAHFVMALDLQSNLLRQGNDMASGVFGVPAAVGLSWVGPSIAAYLDDDPFWDEAAKAERPVDYLATHWPRIPLAVHVQVSDPAKLALFLGAMRAYQERTAPDLVTWTTLRHGERSYVRVAPRDEAGAGGPGVPLNLYYATTPKALVLSLREEVIHRFLDRQGREPADGGEAGWLGESLALRASRKGLAVLGRSMSDSYRNQAQLRSWANLPILNEWRRLFPDRDPVEVHEAAWGVRPVCPGGGTYVWNERWKTMESTALGHPGEPKPGPDLPAPLAGIGRVGFGISLKENGLRSRVDVEMISPP